ncbi:NAD-dependent epimerase/dehydratase family protein [Salegentibacter chungangensis]|uniref:NAD-dependent epimerase/dehydratase family protein n=1 Tax=Salegentibacter chungangensis TaxID=1335724 RepID=A0ABW3NUN0_9FLAO
MKNLKQTILGAGGAIGTELAKALSEYTNDIRLVSRHPKAVNENDELFPADLQNTGMVQKAVKGSAVVYLCAGLEYNFKIWKKSWPKIMANVISACIAENARLVFFDNVYMYDKGAMGNMTENAPINPPSKKGMVRAEIAQMLMQEVKEGNLKALIARSADFYGPGVKTSMLTETVIKPMIKGKKANWLGGTHYKHSFTYTPDAALAVALLGNSEEAYDQVWHLPTAGEPPTGKEWTEMVANELNTKAKVQAVPKWMVKIIGLFIPIMREMPEMMYQYDRDYIFRSDKFEKAFSFKPTPYREGVKKVVEAEIAREKIS